jgi:MFS family permease
VLGAGLGGLALLAALVAVERRAAAPLLELRLFGDRLFRSANLAFFLSAASLVATLFLLPLFLQGQRGLSALASVLTILPQGLGVAVAAPLADRLYTRVGPRRLIALGLAGTAVATALLALVDLGTDLWWLRALILLRGVAIGLTIVPVGAATFAAIAPADMGRASALFNANRQVASAVGVAVLATVLAGRTRAHVATALAGAAPTAKAAAARQGALLGFHDACAAAVLIALLGVACAFLIRDEDVMAPLRRQPDRAPEPLPEM